MERTTMRWFATPRRTRFGSWFSAKNDLSASASAGASVTSPSRRMPGRSSATAPRLMAMWPLTLTSAAAMWLGSRSSPTTDWLFLRFLLSTLLVSAWRTGRLSDGFVESARPVKREEAGREARLDASDWGCDYQLLLAGQPPLVLSRVQERVTVPSSFFLMVNVLVVFDVAV